MKISYLVTCSTETDTLNRLLNRIIPILGEDELIILQDKNHFIAYNDTYEIILKAVTDESVLIGSIRHYTYPLDNDYGQFKNHGIEKCSDGNYVFQIDGDEMPPDSLLGENLHALIESNSNVEVFAIPRINAWHGLTDEYKNQWSLDMSPTYNRLRAAWPDYQLRLFKSDPEIRFKNRLHERIDGYKTIVTLPTDETYAIYHDKTIEVQLDTNRRYNRDFTMDENRGISDKK